MEYLEMVAQCEGLNPEILARPEILAFIKHCEAIGYDAIDCARLIFAGLFYLK